MIIVGSQNKGGCETMFVVDVAAAAAVAVAPVAAARVVVVAVAVLGDLYSY